nr:GspH/FimT family protein [Prolinoborus fasciculus]
MLAILTSIALPYFHKYQSRQEAKQIPIKLSAVNRYARSQAAVFHQNIVICPSQDSLSCHPNQWNKNILVFIDKNKNRQVDTGEQILQIDVLNLKYGNLSWRGALSLPSVTYQAHTALPIGSNGSFYYCSTHLSNQQRIVLSKMGHIRIESLSSC